MRIGILGSGLIGGKLGITRYIEPLSLLIARIAYEGEDGAAVAYRIEHLEEIEA